MEIDVKHVADLARSGCRGGDAGDGERPARHPSHIERLKEVPVDDVPPTFGPAKSAGLRLEEDAPKRGCTAIRSSRWLQQLWTATSWCRRGAVTWRYGNCPLER
jgi:hypothetical protein